MNKHILNKEVQDYITDNLSTDLVKLRLKKSPFTEVTSLELVEQIQGKKIAKTKHPFLFNTTNIYYPPHINLEQSSSSYTAEFKAELIKGGIGVDLTGGMGIDAFFISKSFNEYTLLEPNKNLLEIDMHNFSVLGRDNVSFNNTTAEEFLKHNNTLFDTIYIDPSRRDENKNKKVNIEELAPNILEIQEFLHQYGKRIFIKFSPLLDIHYTINLIKGITTIYIIAVKNEVKELLLEINNTERKENPEVRCINLSTEEPDFRFTIDEETNAIDPIYSEPKRYLYIPNNAILKSGAFKTVANKYALNKLEKNTHLYTSDDIIKDFPGRIFKLEEITPTLQKGDSYNIITKNYPLSLEQIKQKYKIKEGGDKYLLFTSTLLKKYCLLVSLI